MTPIVYTKPGCVGCKATHRDLTKREISYVAIDVSTNPEAYEQLMELGFQQMPVVYANGEYWTGYRPDKIKSLAAPEDDSLLQ